MSDYRNIPSLRKYVRTRADKNTGELEESGLRWLKALAENRLNYEIDWLGVPVIQTPEDLVLIQELVFKVQPDFIIETGIAHGGGLIYYASLMELLGKGRVIGVDIEIKEHNRKVIETHPLSGRIELIEGDSASRQTIQKIKEKIPGNAQVIVCLDSDHTKSHVLKELELYKSFIPPGGYFVVFDTVISRLAAPGNAEEKYVNNSPKEAIDEFLQNNPNFEVDKTFNKLYVSSAPDGYLKRIR
jgi:cephalosporin hydroxylase